LKDQFTKTFNVHVSSPFLNICHNETLLITLKGDDQKLLYANLNCYSVPPAPPETLY